MWRDKRTGTILAVGAVQNWPTPKEEQQMMHEVAQFQREQRALEKLAAKADNKQK